MTRTTSTQSPVFCCWFIWLLTYLTCWKCAFFKIHWKRWCVKIAISIYLSVYFDLIKKFFLITINIILSDKYLLSIPVLNIFRTGINKYRNRTGTNQYRINPYLMPPKLHMLMIVNFRLNDVIWYLSTKVKAD